MPLTDQERASLEQKLIENRCKHKEGRGTIYWNSVIDLFDDFMIARQ